ncbi:MAG: hypothetical protein ABS69_06390 [Nitrosomonadales bacterium SCN 54-20]|nr:MAG: hypothetical protein ABS69_06390 [Nitrosomonadales bacterium SCN 54-20]
MGKWIIAAWNNGRLKFSFGSGAASEVSRSTEEAVTSGAGCAELGKLWTTGHSSQDARRTYSFLFSAAAYCLLLRSRDNDAERSIKSEHDILPIGLDGRLVQKYHAGLLSKKNGRSDSQ